MTLLEAIRDNNLILFQKLVNCNKYDSVYLHETLLHTAVSFNRFEMVKIFIELGIDVNTKNRYGNTPIIYLENNYDILKLLLENGADVNIQDNNGDTLLHILCFSNCSYQILEMLLDYKINPFLKTKHGENAFEIAKRREKQHIIDFIFFYNFRKEIWSIWELE